jgi:methyl-accepting chemotaxis protein
MEAEGVLMAIRGYNRRRILIDDAQYRLLAFNLIYFFCTLAVIAAVLFIPLMIQLKSGELSLLEKQEVANHLLSLHAKLWPALFALFVFLTIHSIFVSHRIWGALFRFRKVFKSVSEGDLSVRAMIRKNDYLWKEADLLNHMVENLESRHEQLSKLFAGLKRSTESGSAWEVGQHIESLQAMMTQLEGGVASPKGVAEQNSETGNSAAHEASHPIPRERKE